MRPESGFRIAPNWPKLRKMTMTSQFFDMRSSSIFWTLFCSSYHLINVSYLSKFRVNIITRSGVMTIFSRKGLTRIQNKKCAVLQLCMPDVPWVFFIALVQYTVFFISKFMLFDFGILSLFCFGLLSSQWLKF